MRTHRGNATKAGRAPGTRPASPPAKRSRSTARIVGALLMVWGTLIAVASPASATLAPIGIADFPTQVQVGQTIPVDFNIQNQSNGMEALDTVTLDKISLVLTCATGINSFTGDCPVGFRDPGTIVPAATGVGEPLTACAGRIFNIVLVDPTQGKYDFTPADMMPVVLGKPGTPTDTCRIQFNTTVVKAPTLDADPGVPGIQTLAGSFDRGHLTNNPAVFGSVSLNDEITVALANPTITTQAFSQGAPVGVPPVPVPLGTGISDQATLSGLVSPIPPGPNSGTITFNLYADNANPPTCASPPVFTATVPATANGTYATPLPDFTPPTPGTYQFVASYSGDANNTAVSSVCGAEPVVVSLAKPMITTTASQTVPAGGTISDTAVLANGLAPTGTITFTVYGPSAPGSVPDCTTPTVFAAPLPTNPASVPVAGNGPYPSPSYIATQPGVYRFVASYGGDGQNQPAGPTPCGDPAEDVLVTANPTIVTAVTAANVVVGGTIQDTATVSNGLAPIGGTVTFTVYGPDDATCANAPFATQTVPVDVPGPADPTTATAKTTNIPPVLMPGIYRFTAIYNGDGANNNPSLVTPCGAPNEQVTVAKTTPTIATAVTSAAVNVGGTIQDNATVSGGNPPIGGTVTFRVYGPNDLTCVGPEFAPAQTVPVTTPGPGGPTTATASTTLIPVGTPLPANSVGVYRFTAVYNGDATNNATPVTPCGAPNEQVTVNPVNPLIVTTASAAVPVGGMIHDTATLSNGFLPTGSITFTAYGPFDPLDPNPPVCTTPTTFGPGNPTNPVNVTVAGNGSYDSPNFTATQAGIYRFVASYSGDANNTAAGPTACSDAAEAVVVTKTPPQLTTLASAPVQAGGTVHDTATLSGGFNPTGTITFTVFGPFDPNDPNPPVCLTPSVLGSPNPVDVNVSHGNGNYDSPFFTVNKAGIYRFVASYSGDANNAAVGPTACADPAEDVLVPPKPTQITTAASGSGPVGGMINDTATLSGGTLPTGTITFSLFGPDNATCTGAPIFMSTVPVSGNGSYPSGAFTPLTAGTYRFIAGYSGDPNNLPAVTFCSDPAENVVLTKFPTGLTTVASGPVTITGAVHDTAILTGGSAPTGTIIFDLFGPDNATCTGAPAFTSTVPVSGAGSYQSGDFTPTLPGTYRFQARYSGDPNNAPIGPTVCTDPAEDVLVSAIPTLITTASATVAEGGTISDTATLSGGITPTGTITFNVFGPDNATCVGVPAFTATVPVAGNGTYQSGNFLIPIDAPPGPGVYRFQATYTSGDANNVNVGPTACSDPNEDVLVTPLPPAIQIVKTANPLTLPEPGGTFTFDLVVTNTGPRQLTITSLVDSIYGDVSTKGTCTTAIGTVLPPGGLYTCNFPGTFTGLAPAAQTDTATVTGVDKQGTTVNDSDDAVVSLTPTLPVISVVKTASPASLPEPGGTFTFSVVVTNTSIKPVTLTALVDDVYGDLNGKGTCAVGATLAASGGTYSCTFPGVFNGTGGQNQTDTVKATAVDKSGNSVSAQDNAIVAITSLAPSITVQKSVTPSSLPEPGGTFTFTATVNNTSSEVLTLTSFVDDIYGDLNGKGTCSVPQTLAIGGSYTCTFPGNFTGFAPDAQTDTVKGTAVDTQGRQATAQDSAVVTLTLVPPTIAVVKTADPLTKPEPGGTFTFTVATTNTSFKIVTVTSLTDNVYGDLNGQGSCAIGAVLAPGATYTCSFTGPFTGLAPAAQTDTVTAKAKDNRGNEATAMDDAIVALTPVAPTIQVTKSPNPSERPAPGGPFDFTVSVKNTTFEPLTLTVLTDSVYGDLNGKGTCATGATIAPGATYTCVFTGNFTGVAGDAQTDTVTATGVNSRGQSATATANARVVLTPAPTIVVTKTPNPTSLPEPGGPFTFTVGVKNTTTEPLTVTKLIDSIYGDLNGKGSCAIGTTIAPGGTYTCSFVGNFTGKAGDAQTDTVTATAVNSRGQEATANANATVNLTPVPTIAVTKVADPLTRPEPGGNFDFTVGVKNTTSEPLTLTKLVDNVYGDLNGKGSCSVPQTLAVGATYTCKFPGTFTGKGGDAQTDTVTATAVNSRGQQATAEAKATVNLTPLPMITVTKVADPTSRPEPGGSFDFTVGVKNTTTESLTLTKLVDNVYGDLNGKGSCSVPQTIAVGATYTCKFPGTFSGKGGDAQTDTVTATAVNSRGEQATAEAKATVNLTPVTVPPTLPRIITPVNTPIISPPSFVTPQAQTPFARTGFGLGGPVRLAMLMMLAGLLLILATWRGAARLPAKVLPDGMVGKMTAVRRSRAERSAARASARLRRSRGPEPRWQGARSSWFSRSSNRSGRSRRRGL